MRFKRFSLLLPALCLSALALLLATMVRVDAEHITYRGIHVPNSEIVFEREGSVLLKTTSERGTGWVWLPTDALTREEGDPPPTLEQDIELARRLLEREGFEGARELLARSVTRAPGNQEVRLLYAQALRRLWRFEPAYFLLKSVIDEIRDAGGSEALAYDLLEEAAEVAVLWGDRSEARLATTALILASAKLDDDGVARDYAKELREQSRGKAEVVGAAGPFARPREDVARERSTFDKNYGDNIFTARIGERAYKLVDKEKDPLRTQSYCWIGSEEEFALNRYLLGQSEEYYRYRVHSVFLRIRVNGVQWKQIYDWRKQVILYSMIMDLTATFPNARCEFVIFAFPERSGGSYTKLAESVSEKGAIKNKLETNEYRDTDRDYRLRLDALERKRGRNR